jgi:SAM-dependent methyltransferase
MFASDAKYLCCPQTGEALKIKTITRRDYDGEVLDGELVSAQSNHTYVISNGIPRFVFDKEYNKTWDYKWTHIDGGKGLNYRIVDKSDPAYQIHDIFDRNNHKGKAYEYARGKLVLDLGCGVGQYSYRLIEEYAPEKLVALDLTGGVDVFRKIMLERFPQYKPTILFVQANVFQMPFCDETFDYVFSLGVLQHTGNTREAIRQAARVVKFGGQINFWIYGSEPVPYSAREQGRSNVKSRKEYVHLLIVYKIAYWWINSFRKMRHDRVVSIVRFFSSDFWYKLNIRNLPVITRLARLIWGTVQHPDFDYRFINNYDGWVNTWDETWNEDEIFPTLRQANIVIQGISDWRLGIWGIKLKDFYI